MKLDDFAKPLAAKNNFVKISIGGFSGAGKTYTASELLIGTYKLFGCKKPVLFLDNEKGSRFLVKKFQDAGIVTKIKETTHLADVLAAFEYIKNGDIDFLFIDSLTNIYYQFCEDFKKKANINFIEFQHWGKIKPEWRRLFDKNLVQVEGNIIFTGRGGFEYEYIDVEKNGKIKKELIQTGVKMKVDSETPYEPDLNIWMERIQENENGDRNTYREAQILKDRTSLLDGKSIRNPKFADFIPFLDYLMAVPKGEVSGATFTENLVPDDNDKWTEKWDQKQIEIEKIHDLFIKNNFGSSNDDKKYKILISERFFSTSSKTEIEKLSLERLERGRRELSQFFEYWSDALDKEKFIKDFQYEEPLPENHLSPEEAMEELEA